MHLVQTVSLTIVRLLSMIIASRSDCTFFTDFEKLVCFPCDHTSWQSAPAPLQDARQDLTASVTDSFPWRVPIPSARSDEALSSILLRGGFLDLLVERNSFEQRFWRHWGLRLDEKVGVRRADRALERIVSSVMQMGLSGADEPYLLTSTPVYILLKALLPLRGRRGCVSKHRST